MTREDEETPVPLHRRSTGSITSWGIVEAWLAGDPERLINIRMGIKGLEVGASNDGITDQWEMVAPNEDPSAATVRAIGKLPPK